MRVWRVGALSLLLLVATGLPSPSRADEIHLKNGDRLTGEIDTMEDDTLKLKVLYGEDEQTIQIEWKHVQRVTAEKPLSVEFYPEGVIPEEDEIYETTRLKLTEIEDTERLPLSRVEGINTPDIRHRFTTDLGGSKTAGNTDTAAMNISLDATLWSSRHRGNINAKYNYAEADGRQTANNSRGSVRYDYFLTKKLFASASQLFEQDTFQGLDLRSTTGLGIGRQFIDTSRHRLGASIGAAAVYQDFEETGSTTTPSAIWAVVWEYEIIADDVVVWHRQQGARDYFSDSKAWRLNADQGIRVTLWDDFYFNFEYDLRFNTQPEPGKRQTDSTIIFGLGVEMSN